MTCFQSAAAAATRNSSETESVDVSMHCMEAEQDDKSLEYDIIKELTNTFRAIKDRKNFRSFINEEGFEDVLDQMLCFSHSQAVQELGCNLLLHVVRIETGSLRNTRGHEFWRLRMSRRQLGELKGSLMRSHLVDILVLAMQTFSEHAFIQSHAITILAKLVHPRLFTGMQEVHVHIVMAIRMHVARPKIVLSILSSLFSLCKQHFEFCRALLDHDILAVMKTVMHIHDEHVDITGLSCQLIFLLVDKCVAANYKSAHMLDCLEPVLKVLVAYRPTATESTTLMAACGILWHLANGSGEAKQHLVMKTKAVSCLVRLLLQHSHDRDLMVMVCGTCCALSMSDESRVLSKLSRCLLLDALGPIWYRYHEVELVIEPVLIILIRIDDFRGGVIGVGTDEVEMPMLDNNDN
ncbi:hypothetical protein MPSEU_000139200 [Mayamaea pseudoterrestris]|nr:hypothetical protein MPSEU_000139200 [Mayamaea pseudoterrestris]